MYIIHIDIIVFLEYGKRFLDFHSCIVRFISKGKTGKNDKNEIIHTKSLDIIQDFCQVGLGYWRTLQF